MQGKIKKERTYKSCFSHLLPSVSKYQTMIAKEAVSGIMRFLLLDLDRCKAAEF